MAGTNDIYPTYTIEEITRLKEVKNFFPEGYEEKNNWLFLSMQGYHGTHLTLDKLQEIFDLKDEKDKLFISVLIVQPRLCNLYFGEIPVTSKDLPWLRSVVKKTIEEIPKTQKGNL